MNQQPNIHTLRHAVFAGPLGGLLFGAIMLLFLMIVWQGVPPIPGFVWGVPMVGALLGLFLGTPVMLLVGLAAHHALKTRGWVWFWQYILVGSVVGMVLAVVVGQLGQSLPI